MKKTLIKAVAAIAVVILAAWCLALPLFMHKSSIQSEISAAFEAATGMKLEIQGDATVKIFPLPHLIVDSMYVSNSAGARAPFLLTIKTMEIWPSLGSFFGKTAIKKLQVSDLNIEIETLSDGRLNFEDMSSFWDNGVFQAKNVHASGGAWNDVALLINAARVNYTRLDGSVLEYSGINGAFHINSGAEKATADIRFTHQDRPYVISAQVEGGIDQIFSSASASFNLSAVSDKTSLAYEGTAGFRDNNGIFNGKLKLDTDDLAYWVRLYRGERSSASGADYRKIPVSAKAQITMANAKKIGISGIELDGPIIKGAAAVDVALPDHMDLKAQIHALNLEDIIDNGFLVSTKQEPGGPNPGNNSFIPQSQPSRPLSATVGIKIDDAVYNGKHITNTGFSSDVEGRDFTLPQFVATLPGDSHLTFTGIGKIGLEGVTVEGQTDISGNDLYQALGVFKPVGIALPAQDFKRFHLRTNALVSLQEVRLSELAARIGNMALTGGMIMKQAPYVSVRAAFSISGLNLDHFTALWGLNNWQKALFSSDLAKDDPGIVSIWLKRLGYNMSITMALEKYVLEGKQYDHATLGLGAAPGKIQVESSGMPYNGSVFSGKVTDDVSGVVPKVDVQMSVDNFDKDAFFAPPAGAAPGAAGSPQDRWSTDIMDFHWMGMVNATYNLKFGHFRDKSFEADNMALSGSIADQKLNINSLRANIYGADVAGRGVIEGGTIPTASFAATIASMNVESLARLFPILHGVSGTMSASMALSTNGINLMSWISNLAGTVGISARDIEAHNFNLPGIIRAVSYVRQVADIVGVIQRTLPKGNTLFSGVEGEWHIVKGVAITPRMKISSDQADGTLASQCDLVHWTTSTNITFGLRPLDAANPPLVIVKLAGDLDTPSMELDTRSLEQYVNNRTSERMMQGYGPH